MNIVKKLFNIGLCASIQNLSSNNKQIGGFNSVVVLCKTEESQKKFYFTASSIYGDHVSQENVFLYRSKKYKTKEELIGTLTKEVRLAQYNFPEIYFFKTVRFVEGEITKFDEFLNDIWIRSKYKWSWDPIQTMRDDL